jgi:hypothetical protein
VRRGKPNNTKRRIEQCKEEDSTTQKRDQNSAKKRPKQHKEQSPTMQGGE